MTTNFPLRLVIVSIFVMGLTVLSAAPAALAGEINAGSDKIAIKGYDPVAYFMMNKAVQGSSEQAYEWLGATWYFASRKHQIAFKADPVKFMPQYGGYCAIGVSMGRRVADIDPEAWQIVDGKLYLNYSPDLPGEPRELILRADANWEKHKQYFTRN